jgi:hypothetical protein
VRVRWMLFDIPNLVMDDVLRLHPLSFDKVVYGKAPTT